MLRQFGVIQSASFDCVLQVKKDIFGLRILVYVDHIMILSDQLDCINQVKIELKSLI